MLASNKNGPKMYILIMTVFMTVYGGSGTQSVATSIHSTEFADQKTCQVAADLWLRDTKENLATFGTQKLSRASVICTKK